MLRKPKRAAGEAASSSTSSDEAHQRKKAAALHRTPTNSIDSDDSSSSSSSSSSPSSSSSVTGLRLLSLLLQSAESIAANELEHARYLLLELSQISSPFGTSPERVAAYFTDALNARIVSTFLGKSKNLELSPASDSRAIILARNRRILQAFHHYNSISPLVKFSHFTANQAIFQALEGEDRVHIIDLDIMQGLQWPGLFHILASRSSGIKIKSLRITGLGSSIELLQATGRRLSDFAASLGFPFEFHPMEAKIGSVDNASVLFAPRDHREVTVVHWMQHRLYDVTGSDAGTIRVLRDLRPKIITVVEQDLGSGGGGGGGGGFLCRFVEALHYYSALFDALSDSAGDAGAATGEGGSMERHLVERQVFGCEIKNMVAGEERVGEVRRWGEELGKVGFLPVSLAGSPATQASLLLGMYPWKGYTLVEENGCLKLGWKDLSLLTASAWQPPYALLAGDQLATGKVVGDQRL